MTKKHKNQSKETRVYAYGAYPSVENAQLVDDIFFRAHRLRNDLIRVELDYRQERDQIVRQHSTIIRDLENEHAALLAKINQKEAEVKAKSIEHRERCLAPELKDLRKQWNQVGYKLDKERRAEERRLKQHFTALPSPRLEELQQQMTVAKSPATKGKLNKAIRAEWKSIWAATNIDADMMVAEYAAIDRNNVLDSQCGILWPTKNTIKADVARAIKDGPRIRSYDGSGRIGGQPSTKGISVAKALADGNNWLRITGVHEKCTRGHAARLSTAWIRIDSRGQEPVWAAISFVMHRALPPDAHVTNIYITRTRVAGKLKYEIQFTLAAGSWTKTIWPQAASARLT